MLVGCSDGGPFLSGVRISGWMMEHRREFPKRKQRGRQDWRKKRRKCRTVRLRSAVPIIRADLTVAILAESPLAPKESGQEAAPTEPALQRTGTYPFQTCEALHHPQFFRIGRANCDQDEANERAQK